MDISEFIADLNKIVKLMVTGQLTEAVTTLIYIRVGARFEYVPSDLCESLRSVQATLWYVFRLLLRRS